MQQVTFKFPQRELDDLQYKCTVTNTHLHDAGARVKETKNQIKSLWKQVDKLKSQAVMECGQALAVVGCGQALEKLYEEFEKRIKHMKTKQDAKYDVERKIGAIWRQYSKDEELIHDRRKTIGKQLMEDADKATNLAQFPLNMLHTTAHLVPMLMAHPACNRGPSTEPSAQFDSMRHELFVAGVPDTPESTDLEVETETDLEVGTAAESTDLAVGTAAESTDLAVGTDTDLELETAALDTDLAVGTDTDLEVETAAVDTDLEAETAAAGNANQQLPANVAEIIFKHLEGWALIDLGGGREKECRQHNAAGK